MLLEGSRRRGCGGSVLGVKAWFDRLKAEGKEFGYQVKLSNVFHAGDGNLHPNISYDGRNAEERQRVLRAGEEILWRCLEAGGSLAGEHGVRLGLRDV